MSPACTTPERPKISTAVAGPASVIFCPRSSSIARMRPYCRPHTNGSPTRSVPSCTSTVATGPRPRSSLASMMAPRACLTRLARSSSTSACSRSISNSSGSFSFVRADTGTTTVSPPHSSGTKLWFASSCFTRSAFAPGRSILLTATTIGTFAACA